jgi:hypothetical protein
MKSIRRLRIGIVGLVVAFVIAGCHRTPRSVDVASIRADSAEGTVRVVGVDALPRMTLATDDGRGLALDGPDVLRRVAGLRVMVSGTRGARDFHVATFRVTAAAGVPAIDGVLATQDGMLVLLTADGRRFVLRDPPEGLRATLGHRVWVTGPPNGPPVSYGLIE